MKWIELRNHHISTSTLSVRSVQCSYVPFGRHYCTTIFDCFIKALTALLEYIMDGLVCVADAIGDKKMVTHHNRQAQR